MQKPVSDEKHLEPHHHAIGPEPTDLPSAVARVRELESLCLELYRAAVEYDLPAPLLNSLWEVGARGNHPHAFECPLPAAPNASTAATAPGAPTVDPAPTFDPAVRLVHRPEISDRRPAKAALKPLDRAHHHRTLLLVDDEPLVLELLVRILSREPFALLTSDSPQGALNVLEQAAVPIDLLVTDYRMPEMTGRELAEKVRERDRGVRVLYQTGFTDLLFEGRVEVEPAAAFIEKPYTATALIEAVRLLLFGSIQPSSTSIQPSSTPSSAPTIAT